MCFISMLFFIKFKLIISAISIECASLCIKLLVEKLLLKSKCLCLYVVIHGVFEMDSVITGSLK